MNSNIYNTFSFTLFGVQGLLGGVFASIFRAVIDTRNDGFTYNFVNAPKPAGYDLAMATLSAGFGIAFGIITGLFVLLTTNHERLDHFTDYTYWVPDDGIRYPNVIAPIPQEIIPEPIAESDIYVK
jgi:hypothetical protein